MKAVKTSYFLAAVLFLCACPAFGVTELKDGQTHNFQGSLTDSIWLDYEAPGMNTTVNLLSGALGGSHCLIGFENSRINMAPSSPYLAAMGTVNLFDSSQVNMTGESSISRLIAFDSSQVNMSGKTSAIGRFYIYGSSHASISSGILEYTETGFNGILDISGGTVSTLEIRNSSQVNISGGIFATYLLPMDSSTVRIYGYNFAVDGVPVGYGQLNGSGVLTGTLASGESINNLFSISQDAKIILVPEPATLLLLGLGWPIISRLRKKK
jgi:hypothetical protein